MSETPTPRGRRLFGWLNDPDEPWWERPGPTTAQQRRDVIGALVYLAVALGVVALSKSYGMRLEDEAGWRAYLAVALMVFPLSVRRRWPLPVLVLASGLFVALAYLSPEVAISVPFQVAYFAALYSAVAWAPDRRLLWILTAGVVVAMALWITIALTITNAAGQMSGLFEHGAGPLPPLVAYALYTALLNAAYFGGAVLIGRTAWRTALDRVRVRAQAEQIAEQAAELARRAVLEERVRIARELHDVIAHHVSVIGVQAAASRRMLPVDPERSAQALRTIESTSREAVEEMRSLLHILRNDETPSDSRAPEPGLGDIDALARTHREAGLIVTVERVEAEPGDLNRAAAPLSLSAYRCVQESLTNVRSHSTARRASVTLRTGGEPAPSWLEVEVLDDGRPRGATSGTGYGLRGIRERAALHHGEVDAGPREPGPGWRVRVRFPYREAAGNGPSGAGTVTASEGESA
ncbi:sensor histidine kinase [Ruania alkalisoli]|uniref:histidine kinase n=1 Tax=Ruania alkalisoli TaxID=2779775 RepID=A0A7M1SXZ8_9MICO|nr:sensor histidine kinase [Ruania alkalisoli]QOR72415.1 sensor histidine kinase [Ruania alkalisoli]